MDVSWLVTPLPWGTGRAFSHGTPPTGISDSRCGGKYKLHVNKINMTPSRALLCAGTVLSSHASRATLLGVGFFFSPNITDLFIFFFVLDVIFFISHSRVN